MLFLAEGSQGFLGGDALGGVGAVDVAELIESEVGAAPVDIAPEAFEAAVEQCLAHDAEVLTQRIEQGHTAVERHGGIVGIVFDRRQRVVENLVEALAGQLIADAAAQLVVEIGMGFVAQRSVETRFEFDVVVTVDSEDVLYDVARTADVDAVGGNFEVELSLSA